MTHDDRIYFLTENIAHAHCRLDAAVAEVARWQAYLEHSERRLAEVMAALDDLAQLAQDDGQYGAASK